MKSKVEREIKRANKDEKMRKIKISESELNILSIKTKDANINNVIKQINRGNSAKFKTTKCKLSADIKHRIIKIRAAIIKLYTFVNLNGK